ncbi:hypothetical protein KG088_17325 [Halomonas sp. TRM85114]|uniref:hypothetical protein n=1 Tax=Halomonas jincaotanensis TaxID=2810616 RepID=UPI001BD24170|nr:hypothetical protein [Halomonas jincaotanensis]MBS9405375.1 hypothetical protein [Halomonas jincaotanensis]
MDRQEAIRKLIAIQNRPAEYNSWLQESTVDQHKQHVDADKVLCELLTSLGYEDVVEEYRKIDKWYS